MKVKSVFLMGVILAFCSVETIGQVSINTDGSAPDGSAMLEIKSNSKGFLPPRVALTAINIAGPVSSPVSGLILYNTATAGTPPNNVTPGYYYWNDTQWKRIPLPDGSQPGDMLRWDGVQWSCLSPGNNGRVLMVSDGMPTWGQYPAQIPLLLTNSVSGITTVTALGGGNVCDGGAIVTERGICWSASPDPTTSDTKTIDGAGCGTFTSNLTGLTPNSSYHVRAYATNSEGTGYGNDINFTTRDGVVTITTTTVSIITAISATSGGTITDDGGAAVTARGVCWRTTSGPTIADSKTSNGTGTGTFTSNLTSLTANTIYYVRAYATNSVGTSYGNEVSFTTRDGVVALTTTAASGITALAASSGGNITDNGGAAITARGVCWNTSPSPTTANNKTTDGSGNGSFTSSLTSLSANTIYYIRAYATNSVGTSYGNELNFTTRNGIVLMTTTTVTGISAGTASSGGTITDDGGASVTIRGVCWSTSPNPTTGDNKTTDGSGTGAYSSALYIYNSPNTLFYIRAYATNAVGTSYGNQLSFTTKSCTSFVDSRDGKTYPQVMIGTQCWMAANLNVGTRITGSVQQTNNGVLEKYCYNDNDANCDTYGGLYQWWEATLYWTTTPTTQGICNAGWHIPASGEFSTLVTYLGGASVGGGKMKETGLVHWASPNTNATNSSGFTGLPAGARDNFYTGTFMNITTSGYFWGYNGLGGSIGAYIQLQNNTESSTITYTAATAWGYSVRCIQD
jgi:uncharacterized protein (TIGR02145 family)